MNNREIRAYNIAVQYEIKRQETVAWAPARIFAKGGIQPSLSSPSASLPFPYPPILLTPYYSPSLISVHPDVPFHPLNHARGSVVRCKLPQNRVRGKAPPPGRKRIWVYFEPMKRVQWQRFWLLLCEPKYCN